MDPIESIQIRKDTTFALILEAQARGWSVYYMTLGDLFLSNGRAFAIARTLEVFDDPEHWFEFKDEEEIPLGSLDVVLMRKDPPFDIEYIMSTYILERAELEGTVVVNKSRSLRDVNEKVFTAWFPECCPPSLLTRSKSMICGFLRTHGKIVVKPADRMAGRAVFVIEKGDPNTNVIIEELTHHGTRFIQAQAYIPEITTSGDKRILLINGIPVTQGIARMPGEGDHRGNMAVGATATGFELSDRDRWICKQLEPVLKERGLFFVGIDVIGDYMTEINVTSPTGICEINKLFGVKVAELFFDELMAILTRNSQ